MHSQENQTATSELASTVKPPLYNSESINLDHNAHQHAPVE